MAPTTRSSLLNRLRENGSQDWQDFVGLYRPFLERLARAWGLRGQDVDELAQSVLVDFFHAREKFVYTRGKGRFRAYLRRIFAVNYSKLRKRRDDGNEFLEQMADPMSDGPSERWDREFREHVLQEALCRVRGEVEPKTYQAFQLYGLEQQGAKAVAEFLGISTSAVYVYKNRVLERLQIIVRELTGDP